MIVSIQQAAANAFAIWLSARLIDTVVEPRWPAADRQAHPSNVISVIPAGPRTDLKFDPRLLKNTNLGPHQTTATWQIAAVYQPFQLDVWAESDVERDDLVARLDTHLASGTKYLTGVFNPDPFDHGVALNILDGWEVTGSVADFNFDEPQLIDTDDDVKRSNYRALYRGGAHMMLTVTAVTARQKVLALQLALDPDKSVDTYLVS